MQDATTQLAEPPEPRSWLDALGGLASATCAAHCFILALAPAALPLLGLEFMADEAAEWVLVATAVVVALFAAGAGFRLHRSRRVLALFAAGIALLLAARFAEVFEVHGWGLPMALLGGSALIVAHLSSIRACRLKSTQLDASTARRG